MYFKKNTVIPFESYIFKFYSTSLWHKIGNYIQNKHLYISKQFK